MGLTNDDGLHPDRRIFNKWACVLVSDKIAGSTSQVRLIKDWTGPLGLGFPAAVPASARAIDSLSVRDLIPKGRALIQRWLGSHSRMPCPEPSSSRFVDCTPCACLKSDLNGLLPK